MDVDKSQIITEVTSFYDAFLQAELSLFEREISGIRYWHFIRFQFFVYLLTLKGWVESSRPQDNMTILHSAGLVLRLFRNNLFHGIAADKQKTELLIANASKRITEANRSVDPFFHTWLDGTDFDYTIWEDHVLWRHVPHNGDKKLFFMDGLHLRAIVHRVLVKKYKAMIADEVALLDRFARQFDLNIDRSRIADIVQNVVSMNKTCTERLRKYLARKKVRVLVTFNHYDPLKMLLTQVAKQLGIRVVELQHGTMGKYHIGYGFDYAEPLATLPDDILSFGKFWTDTTPITKNGVALTTTGYPYFEQKIKAENISTAPNPKRRLLFLGQESIGLQLADIAVKLNRLLDNSTFEIIFKLHPREYYNWKSKYPQSFVDSGIEVVGNVPLYPLLASADVHLGVYSTTVLESLAFDRKLILLNFYGVHYFIDLIKSGRASLAGNAEEIADQLHEPQIACDPKMTVDYFWEPDACDKVVKFMRGILSR